MTQFDRSDVLMAQWTLQTGVWEAVNLIPAGHSDFFSFSHASRVRSIISSILPKLEKCLKFPIPSLIFAKVLPLAMQGDF